MGTVNLYHSRRTCYQECIYWVRDERSSMGDASQWILRNQPSGTFLAKEITLTQGQMNQAANVFAFDRNNITLQSDDDLNEITRGSIVKYNDELYIVDNVQGKIHRKETEFNKEIYYTYVITIRR